MKKVKFIQKLHNSTKRNYIDRMIDNKVYCMNISQKFGKQYWDGDRKFGYGGYKYIKDRWKELAVDLIKAFKLNKKSRILDIGCGKGFLMYEIHKLIKSNEIYGLEISNYAIKNSHPEIKNKIKQYDARNKLKYSNKEFDLAISIGCYHNFHLKDLDFAINEFSRVSKNQYFVTEGYRNNRELFNLQCWALTCKSFYSNEDWKYLLKKNNFKGMYEIIYFN